jgi:hypothetical protein
MLEGYVSQALASKTIIEEPCFMPHEAPIQCADSLLESCTPAVAASQHRGELGVGSSCNPPQRSDQILEHIGALFKGFVS